MEKTTLNFNYGDVIISNQSISFETDITGFKSTQTMDRANIGAVNYEEFTYLKLQVIQYGFRYAIIGIVLMIIGLMISFALDKDFVLYIGFAILLFAGFLIIGGNIDALIGSNFTQRVSENIFGKKGYILKIQNNSGGDHIEFPIDFSELTKAKDLIKYRNADLFKSEKLINELAELLELKKLGILTESEYNLKKSQILNNE